MDVSIIIPIKDEEENILPLAQEIEEAMKHWDGKWECIWIDDGSNDQSWVKLTELTQRKDSPHRIFQHTQCFGQSAALATGFKQARGRILATLDGDGQNDPKEIPRLLQILLTENADVVNGWRMKRNDPIIRKISSKIANAFRNFLTGEKVRDVGCALRVMKKECIENLPIFKGMHRFLPTLIRFAGYHKILEVPVHHRARERGKAKYGIWNRLWVGIADTLAVCWMKHRLVYPKIRTF